MKRTTAVLTSMLLSALIMSGCKNDVDVKKPTSETENENTEQPSNPEQPGNPKQPDTPIQTDANAIISKITTASPAEKEALLNSINSIDFLANHGIQISLDGEGKFSVALPQNLKYNVAVAKHDDKVDIYKTVKAADDEKNKIPAKAKEAVDGCTLPDAVTCIDNNELSILKPLICAAIENANWNNMTYTPEYKDGNIDCKFENLYLKMSDMDALFDGKGNGAPILSSNDGNVVISAINKGTSEARNGSSVIPVALKIKKQANTSFHIDLSNENNKDGVLTKYYRGGFVFNDISNITFTKPELLANTRLYVDDFKDENFNTDKSILDIWSGNQSLLEDTWTICISGNAYGIKDIDKFLEKCYAVEDGIWDVTYDAYDALPKDAYADNQKHMFDDSNTIFSEAPTLNAKAAAAILTGGETNILANVRVTPYEGSDAFEKPKTADGKIVNVQFDTDMSSITDGKLEAYGVVKFNKLPPKKLNPDAKAKIVLIKDGDLTSWENGFDLDVSNLSGGSDTPTNMERYRDSIAGALFVKQAYIDLQPNGLYARTINIGNDFYKTANNSNNSDVSRDYTNVSREKYGNEASINTNASLDLLELRDRTHLKYDAISIEETLGHLNNIKLTPVQKLLLDDQHIYG